MRVVDIQMSIPFLVLALAMVAILGSGLDKTIFALVVTGWPLYARVVRGEALAVKAREYVEAAFAIGVRPVRIIVRHILPNISSSLIVISTLQVGRMILFEASLSFLGLGISPTIPSWGGMIADGRDYLSAAWWVSTIPGLAIFVLVMATNLLGDSLRDLLDPRST